MISVQNSENVTIKKSSLKTNFILNNIRLVLNLLFPIVTFPYISRVLGPTNLGRVEFANSVASYFILFAALGIPTYGVREIARVRDNDFERSKTVAELSLILLFTIFLSYFVYFPLVFFVPQFKTELILFLIVAPNIFLSDFSFEWFYVAIEDQFYITVRYIFVKILQLFAIFFLIKSESDLYFYAIIFVGMNSISTIFNLFRLKKYKVKVSLKSLNCSRHLKSIFLIFAAQIAVSIYCNLDVTMIGLMRSNQEVGIYTAANRIVRIVIVFVTSLSTVIIPRLENALKNNDFESYKKYLEKSLRFILCLALPCFFGLVIVADDAILFFAGSKYVEAVFATQLLSVIIVIVGLASFVGLQVLYTNRKENYYTISVSIAAGCNFFVNFCLIRVLGINGAIIGTIVAESIGLIIMTILGRKFLVQASLKVQFWKYLVATVLMSVAVFFVKKLCVDFSIAIRLLICLVVGAVVYGISLIVLKEKLATEMLGKKGK